MSCVQTNKENIQTHTDRVDVRWEPLIC